MASHDASRDVFEWTIPNVGRSSIINRSIGSPCTINLMLTFPSSASLDTARLKQNVTTAQQLWPLLAITVTDQRTPRPKMRSRRGFTWDPDRIVVEETYDPVDPTTDRDNAYEQAVRLFQAKNTFDEDPVWRVTIFRPKGGKGNVYFAFTPDHLIIDGRGSVRLVKALLGKDIASLPREDVEMYATAGLAQDLDEMPPYGFLASAMFQGAVYPRLPGPAQRWLGKYPVWPTSSARPPIDTPWKSSILDIPPPVLQGLKVAAKANGVPSMNATLHTAWIIALWAVFLAGEASQTKEIKDCTVKDIRDDGDPYCVGGHATAFIWSSGLMTRKTRFWGLAKAYEVVSMDEAASVAGSNMMRMLNLLKDGTIDPETSHRGMRDDELPVGDKRAHTLRENETLKRVNGLDPYGGMSGIWSNLSFVPLPEGATDINIGCGGAATATAFNTVLIGHENGTRVQNSWSDGAAMTEGDVKRAEVVFLMVLEMVAREGKRDWTLREFVNPRELVRAKL